MERFAEDLAAWLTAAGHEVTVVTSTPGDPGGDSHRDYQVVRTVSRTDLRVVMARSDIAHINGLSTKATGLAAIARSPAVITHAAHQAICPVGIAWGPGGLCTADGGHPGPCEACYRSGPKERLRVAASRAATIAAARNVCISDYLARRLQLKRSLTIYNPVHGDTYGELPEGDESSLLYAGRLAEEKGPDLVLHALARLPGLQLRLAGDGPIRASLEKLASTLGIADRVSFLGSLDRSRLLEAYAASAIACVPTRCEEAFGYAAAEAMAAGRAVVATPRGALPELVGDGRGYLANDATADALADAISSALANAQERRERARLGRTFAVREFHIDVVGQRYLQVFEAVTR